MNPLVSLFYLFVGRGGRKRGNRRTDKPSTVTLAAHARRGLIKPYPTSVTQNSQQRHFNYRLSWARIVVECVFGRLEGRWRCLLKRNDCDAAFVPTLVNASCVLHNLCEVHGDDEWLEDVIVPTSTPARTTNAPPDAAIVRDAP